MSLGRWVCDEDVTISKQTFKVVFYPLRIFRKQLVKIPRFNYTNTNFEVHGKFYLKLLVWVNIDGI